MSTRDASIEWVQRQLAPHVAPPALAGRAERLVALAEGYSIDIETLIQWIDFEAPGKRWEPWEFMRWAQSFTAARSEMLALQDKDEWRKLCPQCQANAAHRIGEHWYCSHCGDLP